MLRLVHADHLDRPIRMTDAGKAVVWDAAYRPFGEVQAITGAAALNLRFPGQYFLLEAGLHYNWHRHYDPTLGRYLQPDPLGFVDGPSLYGYVRSAPTMLTDTEGASARGKVLDLVRQIIKETRFYGPNEKYRRFGVGRVCQVRYKRFVIRLDYQETVQGSSDPYYHINIGKAGRERHIPINPFRWFPR